MPVSASGALREVLLMESTTNYPEKVHTQITEGSSSALQRYQHVVLGAGGLSFLIRYELINLVLCSLPGAAGLFLRQIFYPHLIRQVGPGAVFGRSIVLRHPQKITIGSNVVVDDDCVLDARGDSNEGIVIGNRVMLARNIILGCKNGDISLGDEPQGIALWSICKSGISVDYHIRVAIDLLGKKR